MERFLQTQSTLLKNIEEGYHIKNVICTTMSIDASVMIQTICQLLFPNIKKINREQLKTTLASENRFFFFHDKNDPVRFLGDQSIKESLDDIMLVLLNRMAYSVKHEGPVFHPKLILIELGNQEGNIKYRLQIGSKNLTSAYSYEVCAQLESVCMDGNCETSNHNLNELLIFLADHSCCDLSYGGKNVDMNKEILRIADTIKDHTFFLLGDTQSNISICVSGDKDIGKIQQDLCDALERKDNLYILSPAYETRQEKIDAYKVYEPKAVKTHAKLYFQKNDDGNNLWIGSSNLSDGGVKTNIECMVRINGAEGITICQDEKEIEVFGTECKRVVESVVIDNNDIARQELEQFIEECRFHYQGNKLSIEPKKGKWEYQYQGVFDIKLYGDISNNLIRQYMPNDKVCKVAVVQQPKEGAGVYVTVQCTVQNADKEQKANRLVPVENIGSTVEALISESVEKCYYSFIDTPWFCFGYEKNQDMYAIGINIGERLLASELSEERKKEVKKTLVFIQHYYGKEFNYSLDDRIQKKTLENNTIAPNIGYAFQADAINAAYKGLNCAPYRYLVADETGLGKTYVAKGVIKKKKNEKKEAFIVFYFGSNVHLLKNTMEKLVGEDKDFRIIDHFSVNNKTYEIDRLSILGAGSELQAPELSFSDGMIYIVGFSANLLDNSKSKSKEQEKHLLKTLKQAKNLNVTYEAASFRETYNKAAFSGSCKPDLIILDEFHRYYDKLDMIDDLRREKEIPLLLLSATPFITKKDDWKDGTYLDKISDFIENEADGESKNANTGFSFMDLIEFLTDDNGEEYRNMWNTGNSKDIAEYLKRYIWRNERISIGEKYRDLPSAADFIGEKYAECMDYSYSCSEDGIPQRYFSLCPGVWSFMYKGTYQTDGEIAVKLYQEFNKHFKNTKEKDFLFDLNGQVKQTNISKCLRTRLLSEYAVEEGKSLLWVPPSNPLYEFGGAFCGKEGFSKLLVFSGYELIPRMIATVCSALARNDTVDNEAEIVTKDCVADWLEAINNEMDLELLIKLADCWHPQKDTADGLLEKTKKNLEERGIKTLGAFRDDALAYYVIASPLVCAYRITQDLEDSKNIAAAFDTYFKQHSYVLTLQNINTAEDLIQYCFNGNMQALLYEYRFLSGENWVNKIVNILKHEGSQLDVLAKNISTNDTQSIRINCHFAERLSPDILDNGTSATGKTGEDNLKKVEHAFNSPFWPMVLATTSAGQEGIDLDAYCSRIMHFSIPSTPMAFEQRDGRVDRRRSLLARRKMAQMYGISFQYKDWNDFWEWLFTQNNCGAKGMSPDWIQLEDTTDYLQERIIPFFPYSEEYILYRRLLDCKNIYRSQFGSPNEVSYRSVPEKRIKLNNIEL